MIWIIALIVIFSLVSRLKEVNKSNEKVFKERQQTMNKERKLKREDQEIEKEKNWIEELYNIDFFEDETEDKLQETYHKAKRNWKEYRSSKKPIEMASKVSEKKKKKEPELYSEKNSIRSFSDLFSDPLYTLEEIREIESQLTEEEFLYYRQRIYNLEEEAIRHQKIRDRRRKEEGEDIEEKISPGLSPLQKMVVTKEILDKPVSRKKYKY